MLGIKPSDIGRSPAMLLLQFRISISYARQVIADGYNSGAKSGMATAGSFFGLPHTRRRSADWGRADVPNVTAFRASLEQAIYEREYTKAILNTVIDPLVVLDTDLRVQTANQAFYSMLAVLAR